MNVHFVIHEAYESPGVLLEWAESRNHNISFSRVYAWQKLPETAEDIDLLIVMGGPQSADTQKSECPYFDAAAEMSLINKCIAAVKAVLGVCLGAQLLGEALGTHYEHSPEKEIGVFPVFLTEEGLKNPKFSHFGNFFSSGHWHNDMPGLTHYSKVIAYSEGCPRQIIEYTPLVYGFQCHMEFNSEVVESLISVSKDEFVNNSRHRFIQTPDEIRGSGYKEMKEKLCIFMDRLSEEYLNGNS
jgi:GMP synthase (glutamine-hydrolysing)